jgi:hypothetical protein
MAPFYRIGPVFRVPGNRHRVSNAGKAHTGQATAPNVSLKAYTVQRNRWGTRLPEILAAISRVEAPAAHPVTVSAFGTTDNTIVPRPEVYD